MSNDIGELGGNATTRSGRSSTTVPPMALAKAWADWGEAKVG
jgi:hypothetical protein